jgi:hypothetical protein
MHGRNLVILPPAGVMLLIPDSHRNQSIDLLAISVREPGEVKQKHKRTGTSGPLAKCIRVQIMTFDALSVASACR